MFLKEATSALIPRTRGYIPLCGRKHSSEIEGIAMGEIAQDYDEWILTEITKALTL